MITIPDPQLVLPPELDVLTLAVAYACLNPEAPLDKRAWALRDAFLAAAQAARHAATVRIERGELDAADAEILLTEYGAALERWDAAAQAALRAAPSAPLRPLFQGIVCALVGVFSALDYLVALRGSGELQPLGTPREADRQSCPR